MKPFTALAIALLDLIAIIQLLRVFMGWEIVVAGTMIPPWASIAAALVAGLAALMLWRESRRPD